MAKKLNAVTVKATLEGTESVIVNDGDVNKSTRQIPASQFAKNSALGSKVDKVSGKGLSTNDYDDTEKTKVGKIVTNGAAENYLDATGNYSKPIFDQSNTYRFTTPQKTYLTLAAMQADMAPVATDSVPFQKGWMANIVTSPVGGANDQEFYYWQNTGIGSTNWKYGGRSGAAVDLTPYAKHGYPEGEIVKTLKDVDIEVENLNSNIYGQETPQNYYIGYDGYASVNAPFIPNTTIFMGKGNLMLGDGGIISLSVRVSRSGKGTCILLGVIKDNTSPDDSSLWTWYERERRSFNIPLIGDNTVTFGTPLTIKKDDFIILAPDNNSGVDTGYVGMYGGTNNDFPTTLVLPQSGYSNSPITLSNAQVLDTDSGGGRYNLYYRINAYYNVAISGISHDVDVLKDNVYGEIYVNNITAAFFGDSNTDERYVGWAQPIFRDKYIKFKSVRNLGTSGARWTHTAESTINPSIVNVAGSSGPDNIIYNQVIRLLQDIDNGVFTIPDVAFFMAGTNDTNTSGDAVSVFYDATTIYVPARPSSYGSGGLPVNDPKLYTIPGAIRYCIETLLNKCPNVKIIIGTCIPEIATSNTGFAPYNKLIRDSANGASYPLIDVEKECNFFMMNEYRMATDNGNYTSNTYYRDSLHLNNNGADMLSQYIYAEN